MERAEMNEAKQRVQDLLIDPLNDLGLQRPKRVTVEQHDKGLASLKSRLAYMEPDNLVALRESLIAMVDTSGQWPTASVILAIAGGIEKPKPDDSPMVRSYIGSGAGRAAAAEGHLVELYWFLKSAGRPPMGDHQWHKIREHAEENARRRHRIRRLQEKGEEVGSDDARFIAAYSAAKERAAALLPDSVKVTA